MDAPNTLSSVQSAVVSVRSLEDSASSNREKCKALVSIVIALEEPLELLAAAIQCGEDVPEDSDSRMSELLQCIEKVREYVDTCGKQQQLLEEFLSCKSTDASFRKLALELSGLISQLNLGGSKEGRTFSAVIKNAVSCDIQGLHQTLETRVEQARTDEAVLAEEMDQIRCALVDAGGEYGSLTAVVDAFQGRHGNITCPHRADQAVVSTGQQPSARRPSSQQAKLKAHIRRVFEEIQRSQLKVDKVVQGCFVLVGDPGTGKTALLDRLLYGKFPENYTPTAFAEYFAKRIHVADSNIGIRIWDTAGKPQTCDNTPHVLRRAVGAFVIFDVTRPDTFESAKQWVSHDLMRWQDSVYIVLVGNKVDLETHRRVSVDDAESFADEHNVEYVETSARLDTNVSDLFTDAVVGVMDENRDDFGMSFVAPEDSAFYRFGTPDSDDLRRLRSYVPDATMPRIDLPIDFLALSFQPAVQSEAQQGSGSGYFAGWLIKQGRIRKNLKLRWFVLNKNDPIVRYYRSPFDVRALGGFELNLSTFVAICPASLATSFRSCLRVICRDRTWYFLLYDERQLSFVYSTFVTLSKRS